jgi:FkbM family methyltransferase
VAPEARREKPTMRDRVITHFARELSAILFMECPRRMKRRLVAAHTRVTWRYVLAVKFHSRAASPVRIGATTIWPADFGSFRHLFEEVFIRRIYHLQLDTETPRIVDCGSNIGMSLAFFREEYPAAELTAFEPDPGNYARLKSTARASFPAATLHNCALAAVPGRMELYSTTDEGGSTTKSLFRESLDTASVVSESVNVVRLSDFLKAPVDLLKLDVEGAESSVMQDLVSSGALALVKNMVAEFHDISRTGEGSLANFLASLQANGFSCSFASEPRRSEGRIDPHARQNVLIYASRASRAVYE